MNDEIVEEEYFIFREMKIIIDRLYPTFTGWYCIVYDNENHMIYHSNWSKPNKEITNSKEKTIEFTKKEFDNKQNR